MSGQDYRDGVACAIEAAADSGLISPEVAEALTSLWRRRDSLSPAQLDAIRAALGARDDQGFAEAFLERQRRQRLDAEDPGATCDRCGEVAPVDPDMPCPLCSPFRLPMGNTEDQR